MTWTEGHTLGTKSWRREEGHRKEAGTKRKT